MDNQEQIDMNMNNRVCVIELVNGRMIIALVADEETFTDTVFMFKPKLFIINNVEDDDNFSYEYVFDEWLVGAANEIIPIGMEHIIVWYEVEKEIAEEFLAFAHGVDDDDSQIIGSLMQLIDGSTIH